eukprot:g20035.t1
MFFGRIPYGKVRKLHPCRDVDSATASTTWFVDLVAFSFPRTPSYFSWRRKLSRLGAYSLVSHGVCTPAEPQVWYL